MTVDTWMTRDLLGAARHRRSLRRRRRSDQRPHYRPAQRHGRRHRTAGATQTDDTTVVPGGRDHTAQGIIVYIGAPTADALRVAGAWPSPETMVERLVTALEDAAADDGRPDEQRSKLKQLAVGVRSVGYQVAIGALGGAGGNLLTG